MSENRLRKILVIHGERLLDAVRRREPDEAADETAETLVARFAEADPSQNKSATQWLVVTYMKEGFLLEDLAKAHETLTYFGEHRRKLSAEHRDLGRYCTLAELWKAMEAFVDSTDVGSPSGRLARRIEREAARVESKIIWKETDGFMAVVPMTERAAKFWGRGTRWCTSAEKNNAFNYYDSRAPLVILILPDGRKFQLYVTEKAFQFMDDADASVAQRTIEENWGYFGPALKWAILRNAEVLLSVPEVLVDPELCLEIVKKNGLFLRYIPDRLRSESLCWTATKQNPAALSWVPRELCRPAHCWEIVNKAPWSLGCIPKVLLDYGMCIEATRKVPDVLTLVPERFRDRTMCLECVRKKGRLLALVPEHLLGRDMCMGAVKNDGLALAHVPHDLRDREMCRVAVLQNGIALQYVPEEMRDDELNHGAQSGDWLDAFFERIPDNDLVEKPSQAKTMRWDESLLDSLRDSFRRFSFGHSSAASNVRISA